MAMGRRLSALGALLLLGGWLAGATGCESTSFTCINDDCSVAPQPEVEEVTQTETCGPAISPDFSCPASPEKAPAGCPCTKATDCSANFCLTTAVAKALYSGAPDDFEIPAGMCVNNPMMSCSGDQACGTGAVCTDASAIVGTPTKLCVQPCEAHTDCRWKEGYVCYFTGKACEAKACLPAALVDLLDCGNNGCQADPAKNWFETYESCPRDCYCGNGTCDKIGEDASETAETCPEDCK
jgi:hypothetical protein